MKKLIEQNSRRNQQKIILTSLINLPISVWSYRGQDESTRHIGPISQDFYLAFGFGEDERFISTVDADGVALAAIQGMYEIIQEQETLIKDQHDQMTELETRLENLEQINNDRQRSQPRSNHWLGWALLIGFVGGYLGTSWRSYNFGLSRRKP